MSMSRPRLALTPLAVGVSALAIAACGGSSNSSSNNGGSNTTGSSGSSNASGQGGFANVAPGQGKKGGTLKVQSAEGFEHLDPGQSYFQIDYVAVYATQRPLLSFKPDNPEEAVPDLAASMPTVSADGKTVTVHIKPNVKFSPPVNRAVTSADVKYAIERAFTPNVPSGYAAAYFGQIIGAPSAPKPNVKISGIETPNKTTLIFKLKSAFGATMVKAMSMPITVPVPEEYAKKYDAHNPSTYDSNPTVQAFTGPYMIKSYSSANGITLVRNPNWDSSTDFRPAYADKIVWKTGGDSTVVARQTLAGTGTLMADGPPADIVKQAYQTKRTQLAITPLGERYVALNTTKKPFNNVNVRKAVSAVTDKVGMNLVRGGSLVGVPGTHFLTPGQPGFQEAGGNNGFGFDYMKANNDLALAQSYMKKAGYSSGKYNGPQVVLIGAAEDPGPKTTAIFASGLKKLGFNVKQLNVPQATMYSKFCGVPKNAPDVCTTVGWLPDFPDGYANLWVPFNGTAITQANNSNWPQLNNPQVNAAMSKASTVSDPTQRKQAWANVDKLITEQAPAVEWQWSKDPLVQGTGVHGVMAEWNADWDLAYSSVG